jgi:hypothetical protein
VTNGHFDVVVVDRDAVLRDRFFCRSAFLRDMTIVNVFGGAELRQAARAATGSIYRGTVGEGVMIVIRGGVWDGQRTTRGGNSIYSSQKARRPGI